MAWPDEAGVRVGDGIVARDSRPIGQDINRRATAANLEVGRSYRLDIEREGQPMALAITMRRVKVLPPGERAVRLIWQLANLLTLATAMIIGFKRPRDPVALMDDARRLLCAVADGASTAGSVERAAPRVVAQIEAVLHPEFAALMQRLPGETSLRVVASSPAGVAPAAMTAATAVLERLIDRNGASGSVSLQSDVRRSLLPAEAAGLVRASHVDLVVPIQMAEERTQAMLVLGSKRSEQPYGREDLELLTAIASSLAPLFEGQQAPRTPSSQAFEECPQCGTCYDSGTPSCTRERSPLVPVSMPRTLAGRYRLERRLGRGGMGKVYEAVDEALDRRVAVKLIREEWAYSRAAALRFEREARVVAGLAHPNIVTVYDYGVEAGTRAFLVMELLQGTTLREELQRSGRLDAARTLAILRGVCGGVETAHRRQLVHRDLKPDNIFIANDGAGDGAGVKVLDFGVAKPLLPRDETPAPAGADGTETGILVGTVGYMSPEQLLGERPAISWDLWALATVSYESLAGAPPFPVTSRDEWRQAVLAGRHTALSEYLPDAPPRWHDFFARALATDRTRRPGSATGFLAGFEQALVAS